MSVNVNELIIVESLPDAEPQTGTQLHRHLTTVEALPIPVSLVRVTTVEELIRAILDMRDHSRDSGGTWIPMLHLEVHGDHDGTGLVTRSGEHMLWDDLAAAMREVNVVVRNSLIVVLGVCSGALLLSAAANSPFEPAPFFGIIGPDRPVVNFFLPHGFRAFYLDLLTTGDFVSAVNRLRQQTLPEYGGYATPALFELGWKKYEEGLSDRAVVAKRVKRILRRIHPAVVARFGSRSKARARIAQQVRDTREDRHRYYDHFVMSDVYPENAARFPLGAA